MREKDSYKLKKQYSNCDVKELIEDNLARYRVIVKSEMMAMELFKKYNMCFYFFYNDLKKKMVTLLEYAKKNNIKYQLIEDDQVTTEDIIERIRENEAKRVENVYKYYLEYSKGYGDEEKELIMEDMNKTLNYISDIFDKMINEVDEDYINDDLIKRYYSLVKKHWVGIRKQK